MKKLLSSSFVALTLFLVGCDVDVHENSPPQSGEEVNVDVEVEVGDGGVSVDIGDE